MPVTRPRILDLFCGAGGAAVGYHRVGFDVTGVDIKPQPRYPFAFVQADALNYLAEHGHEYDAVHASPPCQAFTQLSARWRGKGTKSDRQPDLLTPTRAALSVWTRPYVVENVVGAKRAMSPSLLLHGAMFGLGVHRPRLFESNVLIPAPGGGHTPRLIDPVGVYGPRHDGRAIRYRNGGMTVAADGTKHYRTKSPIRCARSLEEGRAVMGIDWMEWDELREAIPPAYTTWIGKYLLAVVEADTPAA
jgi:DNA (cytosine-5)-methyltransferase 1